MHDLGEHIEEMARSYRAMQEPLDGDAIADDVLDIAYAQGLLTEEEANDKDTYNVVRDQVLYVLGV